MATTTGYTDEIGDYLVKVDLNDILGKGTYGQVFPGKHARTNREVAVKLLQADKVYVTEDTDREARAMMDIPDNENVLKLYDLVKKEVEVRKGKTYINFYLVLELCPFGSLVDYAEQNSMSLIHKLDVILQGNHGLRHLHHLKPKSFVHRDIKPSNMLVAGDCYRAVLKIGDFGEVKIIEQSKMMESIRGTQSYWAPEMFSVFVGKGNLSYNRSVDVFAKGMSDLALLDCGDKERMKAKQLHDEELGLHLYRNKDKTVQYSIEAETDSEDTKQVKELIKLMIAQTPSDRPSIQEVVDALDYMLTALRARMQRENPPAVLNKLRLRGGEVPGATAPPPTGSTRGATGATAQPPTGSTRGATGATAPPPTGSTRGATGATEPPPTGSTRGATGATAPPPTGSTRGATGATAPPPTGSTRGATGATAPPTTVSTRGATGATAQPPPGCTGEASGITAQPPRGSTGEASGARAPPPPGSTGEASGIAAQPPRGSTGEASGAKAQPPPGSTGEASGIAAQPLRGSTHRASGAAAQPPPGSTRGVSVTDQTEQLPVHEVKGRLSGLDVRAATRDIMVAVTTGSYNKWAVCTLIGDKWEEHPIPVEFPGYGISFLGVHGGVVAMGGTGIYLSDRASPKCYYFSLSTKQWSKLPNMITPRYLASAVEIRENIVMVVGGQTDENNATFVCEILDIERNEWAPGLAMSKGLLCPLVAVLAGCAYVLPRYAKEIEEEKYNRNLEEINTEEQSITQKTPLTHPRDNLSLGLVGLWGKLFFFSVDEAKRDSGHCSQYDPVNDVWSVQETRYPLAYRYPDDCAAVVKDEKILLCGGNKDGKAMLEYSIVSNQWRILSTRLPFQYEIEYSHVGTAHVRV